MVRKIPCRYYEYRNKINVDSGKTIGFIAQEVKEHFPMAVKTTQKEFLPTKMCELENISWNEIKLKNKQLHMQLQLKLYKQIFFYLNCYSLI